MNEASTRQCNKVMKGITIGSCHLSSITVELRAVSKWSGRLQDAKCNAMSSIVSSPQKREEQYACNFNMAFMTAQEERMNMR